MIEYLIAAAIFAAAAYVFYRSMRKDDKPTQRLYPPRDRDETVDPEDPEASPKIPFDHRK